MFFQIAGEKPPIQPETLFSIGNFPITNAMITGVIVSVILVGIALSLKKQPHKTPSKFQIIFEMIVESFVGLLQQITGNRRSAYILLPLIGALFLFLGLGNLITLIPGWSIFTYDGSPLFRTPTNDFNMTFSIALAMVVFTQAVSLKQIGVFAHLGKFVKIKEVVHGFKKSIGDGFTALIDFFVGILDIVSEFAKVIYLSLRLFGNMYAGEVLNAVIFSALAIFVPAPWLGMNLLVGVLQAMVFGSLVAAYFTLGVDMQAFEEEES
jgi:F-type H+-transporting ATPase subunit a